MGSNVEYDQHLDCMKEGEKVSTQLAVSFSIFFGEIIVFVVFVHDVCNHVIGLLD